MEVLKQVRTQHRRLLTQSRNYFAKIETDMNDEEKLLKLRIISEKGKQLLVSEENVRTELFSEVRDEKEIDKEIDDSESYIDKIRVFDIKLENLLSSTPEKHNMSVTNHLVVGPTNLQYPKIKLPVFDGNLKNWLSFWCQFEKIDKDQNIGDHDKFLYLSQSMLKGSPADELLRSFPPSGESYKTAINQLKTRYGKEELLIQVYVRELLALVLQKQSKSEKSLRKLYDQLESKLRSLEVLGVTREKYAAKLFPLVASSIPEGTLKAWERYRTINKRSVVHVVPNVEGAESTTKTELDTLLEFLECEVEAKERE
ncbi:uncharacterized protein [Parasteatoda tepidariorum]|uniref:uncharacterized protein n=1 Tax=Parasteatoda tepidariorum TaxID=114398 RepID=UPI0039BC9E88